MTDEARARIEALERHTELGSGFKIASLDLELRGAGDLLGAEQSGQRRRGRLRSVLSDARRGGARAARRAGGPRRRIPSSRSTSRRFLPDDYVADVGVRLSLYKRLASADRRSETSPSSRARWRIASARRRPRRATPRSPDAHQDRAAANLRCSAARRRAKSVTLHLRDDTPLDPAKVTGLVTRRVHRTG